MVDACTDSVSALHERHPELMSQSSTSDGGKMNLVVGQLQWQSSNNNNGVMVENEQEATAPCSNMFSQ